MDCSQLVPYSFDNCDYGIYTEFIGLNAYNNNMPSNNKVLLLQRNNPAYWDNTINARIMSRSQETMNLLHVGQNTINVNQVLKQMELEFCFLSSHPSNIPSKASMETLLCHMMVNMEFIYWIVTLCFCQYNDIDMYNLSYNVSGIQAAWKNKIQYPAMMFRMSLVLWLGNKTCYGINKSVDNIVAHNIAKTGELLVSFFCYWNHCFWV